MWLLWRRGKGWDDPPSGVRGTESFPGHQPFSPQTRKVLGTLGPLLSCLRWGIISTRPRTKMQGSKDKFTKHLLHQWPHRRGHSNPWRCPTSPHTRETGAQSHASGARQSLALGPGTSDPKAHSRTSAFRGSFQNPSAPDLLFYPPTSTVVVIN